jgi:hypothetical protein
MSNELKDNSSDYGSGAVTRKLREQPSGLKKDFVSYSVSGTKVIPNHSHGATIEFLQPGAYSLHFDMQRGIFWFEQMNFASDGIIDLPSPEYSKVIRTLSKFLEPSVRDKFQDLDFVYKRSVFLYGLPGTGKTVIVNRVARDIIASGGICLWVKNPELLAMAYQVLDDIQPSTLIGVVMEEFDNICKMHESSLLTMLDGQVQKHNVVYLATTNYINRVPARLYRPGRLGTPIEVGFPIPEARRMYLEAKLGKDFRDLDMWVHASEGLSIDELKEMVQACYILEEPLNEILHALFALKQTVTAAEEEDDDEGDMFAETPWK